MALVKGCLPHDPVKLAAAPSLDAQAFANLTPIPVVDRGNVNVQLGMYDNDQLPVCTVANLANIANMISGINGYPLVVDPTSIWKFFAQCIGQPDISFDDLKAIPGAQALDVLLYQMNNGFNIGQQTPLIGLFGKLSLSREKIALAIEHLGHSYMVVKLYQRDEQMPSVWDIQDGRDDGKLVGEHALAGFDYSGLADNDFVRIATWGTWQLATWAWLENRLVETYGLVYRELASASGTNVAVDTDTLDAELKAFAATV